MLTAASNGAGLASIATTQVVSGPPSPPQQSQPVLQSQSQTQVVDAGGEQMQTTKDKMLNEKPFKMNTYIQLEIDSNNFNCLPRICKFCVTRLQMQTDLGSVILAVKLESSKRSFRTIEIPLTRTNGTNANATQTELNLNYNITYPHYLKKDTNILYIYVQRKKKLKTKTILGYKTIAYAQIDLNRVMQRSYSDEIPLYLRTGQTPGTSGPSSSSCSSSNRIGTLSVQNVVSQPVDLDLDRVEDFSDYSDNELADQIPIPAPVQAQPQPPIVHHKKPTAVTLLPKLINQHRNSIKRHSIGSKANGTSTNPTTNTTSSSSSKKFTGKIISFIRKLKNDNMVTNGPRLRRHRDEDEEDEDDEELDVVYDVDLDEDELEFYNNIEQVSDYTDSDEALCRDPNYEPDAYSIVSTPKPKLAPYFSDNNNAKPTKQVNLTELVDAKLTTSDASAASYDADLCLLYVDEADPVYRLFARLNLDRFLLIKNLAELLKLVNIYLSSFGKQQQQPIKLVLLLNEANLNRYVQFYLELLKSHSDMVDSRLFKHYFVSRGGSLVTHLLANSSQTYASMFTDEFWSKLDYHFYHNSHQAVSESVENEIHERLLRYVTNSSESTPTTVKLQLGEVMLNQMNHQNGGDLSSKFIPFLIDVKIGFPFNAGNGVLPLAENYFNFDDVTTSARSSLSTSNSLPQFSNVINTSANCSNNGGSPSTHKSPTNTKLPKPSTTQQIQPPPSHSGQYSPPNSPVNSSRDDSTSSAAAYNLQLDYWSNGTAPNGASELYTQPGHHNTNHHHHHHHHQPAKSTTKALFKSLNIYRAEMYQLSQQSVSGTHTPPSSTANQQPLDLTVVYQIKEKKQKIMRLSKKTKETENKKEVVEGLSRLVCTSKNHSTPLNVFVDDIEYTNIKFLQISSLWRGKQTYFHIHLP